MYNNPRIIALYDRYARSRGLPVMKFFAFAPVISLPALAQVTVQEYPVPKGHGIHDLWADAVPNGPWIRRAARSISSRSPDPTSGK